MSTRGLYGIHCNGIDKLEYSPSDSYPSGLGETVLNICKNYSPVAIKEVFDKLYEVEKEDAYFDINCWFKFREQDRIPYFHDNAFILNSLFCEYVYTINLDEGCLEYYEGFQQILDENNRYKTNNPIVSRSGTTYYPCKCIKTYSFEYIKETPVLDIVKEMENFKSPC